MSAPIITVERLSKSYMLRHQNAERYTALRDVLANKAKSLFRPDRSTRATTEEFFALRDVSFEIHAGDRVGIIGRNGAGKSTLLKVLSRITAPTKGRVTIDGRVASLLEVGTGFHPELSGRENIYLNGSILGMSRAEITSKFDEIVAFAEVEKFLDTPVKRYSSGMYVRLAFAVAAHLEPEILIVDEVLAVGDAEFQRKCLGKMQDVSGQGRTVLFVSHNMEAVQKLCNKGLLLEKGALLMAENMTDVIDHYVNSGVLHQSEFTIPLPANHDQLPAFATLARIETAPGQATSEIPVGRDWCLVVNVHANVEMDGFVIGAGIVTAMGLQLRTVWSRPSLLSSGDHKATFYFDDIHFTTGMYRVIIGLSQKGRTIHESKEDVTFCISEASDHATHEQLINTKSGLITDQARVEIKMSGPCSSQNA